MTNSCCKVLDKIRPWVGCIIGVVKIALGIYNFILAMESDAFIIIVPIVFFLNLFYCFLCTCGLFVKDGTGTIRVNDGTRRGRPIEKGQ